MRGYVTNRCEAASGKMLMMFYMQCYMFVIRQQEICVTVGDASRIKTW